MLFSWSTDGYGNSTFRIWGIKITIPRVIAFLVLCAAIGGYQALTKPHVSVAAGCTVEYPVAYGDRCYRS
jgi:hypothetical protein